MTRRRLEDVYPLPVRVPLPPRAQVGAWLAVLQESQLALQSFEATPLARIQGWSELPPGTPLFATLFVFENYPRMAPPGASPSSIPFPPPIPPMAGMR